MRSSLGAPHSTERCKITNFLQRKQIFTEFSTLFRAFYRLSHGSGLSRVLFLCSWNCSMFSPPTAPSAWPVDTFWSRCTLTDVRLQYTEMYTPWRTMTSHCPPMPYTALTTPSYTARA